MHSELGATTLWAYDGMYPGPTFEVDVDQSITIEWRNNLRDSATGDLRSTDYFNVDQCLHGADAWGQAARLSVHLHGIETTAEYDGHPDRTFLPGTSYKYFYPNSQSATMLWYHDHAVGITRLNTYLGLAGLYIIRESWESTLLPSGAYELPLFIQDKIFLSDGSLYYPDSWIPSFYGRKAVVNGKVWPFHNVERGKYRLRILNGSGSRVYKLYFLSSTGVIPSFYLIGTDQGFLEFPISFTEIELAPAERIDILVDFAQFSAGEHVDLLNSDDTAPIDLPQIMRFQVGSADGWTDPIPTSLLSPNFPDVATLTPIYHQFTLENVPVIEAADECPSSSFLINQLDWDDLTEYITMGTYQIWEFYNVHSKVHPMHIHLVKFRVLEREEISYDGDTPVPSGTVIPAGDEEYYGWKDTVRATPGYITRVLMKFPDYNKAYSGGLFPYHCHNIEHEDYSMMRQFLLVNPTSTCDSDGTCERFEDCQSCSSDCQTAAGSRCGNGLCEAGDGENCFSCPMDCAGTENGAFCCSSGDANPLYTNHVSCSDSRCTTNGFACKSEAQIPACCGDGVCSGQETASSCSIDCSIPTNNDCPSAIPITGVQQIVTGTNYHASLGTFNSLDTCDSLPFGDSGFVWYSFNSGLNTVVTISTCSISLPPNSVNFDTKLYLYSGDCSNLVCEAGNDDSANCGTGSLIYFTSLSPNTEYKILVGGKRHLYDEGNFAFSFKLSTTLFIAPTIICPADMSRTVTRRSQNCAWTGTPGTPTISSPDGSMVGVTKNKFAPFSIAVHEIVYTVTHTAVPSLTSSCSQYLTVTATASAGCT